MKKRNLLGVLTFILMCSPSFANNHRDVSKNVKAAFHSEFAGAEDVKWEECPPFVKACFKLEGETLTAYFSQDGDLMAVTRNILSNHLPIQLLTGLRKEYPGFWITELFELDANNESIYYVTLQDAERETVLKSSGSDWEIYRTRRK